MSEDDFSPALGGAKAQPDRPPQAEASPDAPPSGAADDGGTGGAGGGELPPELAALLGPFGRFAEMFAEAAQGRTAPTRTPGTTGLGDEAADALAREVEAFMGGAIREITQRLPATLAALNGLVDAVEQAITPLVDDLGQAIDAAAARNAAPASPEIVDAVDADGAVDAVDAAPAAENAQGIPPADLPPNA